MIKSKIKNSFIFIFLFLIIFSLSSPALASTNNSDENIKTFINNLFETKNNIALNGDILNFKDRYNLNCGDGKWAFEHEVKRAKYLRDWALERGIIIKSIESYPLFKSININKSSASVRVDESIKFTYSYLNDSDNCENNFGVTLFHTINLKPLNDSFIVCKDYYLDCFEDGLKNYSVDYSETKIADTKTQVYNFVTFTPTINNPSSKLNYNRTKAAEYADNYCGVTWATGKEKNKYNTKYKNFTGIGGNCTNFVSQCLGDKEGGGLKHDGSWYCVYKNFTGAEVSASWCNADAFKNYILYSGKGKLVKKGDFKNILQPTTDSPNGVLSKLQVGDVIAYALGNDVDHTAIITAFDSHGYPLINSHTVDRYHVPFDLGWGDSHVKFILIHIQ